MTKQTKQIGAAISRLIATAHQLKHMQREMEQEAQDKPSKPMGAGGRGGRHPIQGPRIPDTAWRTAAVEAIEERDKLAQKNAELTAAFARLQGKHTLSNYSIDDIEAELKRRLAQAEGNQPRFASTGRVDKSRR